MNHQGTQTPGKPGSRVDLIVSKALTVFQPKASMIVRGEKLCENRTWFPRIRSGALVAIHAGMSKRWFDQSATIEEKDAHVYGAIIGVAEFRNAMWIETAQHCLRRQNDIQLNRPAVRDHLVGPVCWIFFRAWRLPRPIPCQGMQRLWNMRSEIADQVRFQLSSLMGINV